MIIDTRARYQEKLTELKADFGVDNIHALPRLEKVNLNVGLGQNRGNKDMTEYIQKSLEIITGQKAVTTKARLSVAGFKVREGETVGIRVTLRGQKMTDFLNRLINISLPRIREFRGIDPKNFDKQGNLTLGFKDQVPFAELGTDVLERPFGLSVTLTIKNSDAEKSFKLLRSLGFPMKVA